MTAVIFDTETTGTAEPQIIEAAWLRLDSPATLNVTEQFEQRYRPSQRITLGALAVHHIYDEELVDCPLHTDFKLPSDVQYIIGHNIDYDWKVAGQPDVKRICTLALARRYYPDADSHSQSAMIYLIDRPNARNLLRAAHSALADTQNCRSLLANLINLAGPVADWEALWQLSEQARIPKVMTFGKHKGMPIADVPADYKAWLLRQSDVDPYLQAALRR
ncbi:3'-5' exonuclease [Pusillimonas sp. ANT_WB101]|uniref:3'-5' exonuclease n=1 Tax=Pusillimonas sp. ANT_WB101 TaxID=2597356 RepID=UPI0011F08C7E|nr:exonuclease domain-containing protein [Pusillimonas sp. ANT_WB101]KAA0911851.1 3'-5' exonuclease [Pusillimonas sp. ANT_WB101]